MQLRSKLIMAYTWVRSWIGRFSEHGAALKNFFQGLQAFLTSVAILGAGLWFVMQEIPETKLNVTHVVKAVPLDGQNVLVHANIEIENKGLMTVRIDKATAYLQKILPLEIKFVRALAEGQSVVSSDLERVAWPRITDRYEKEHDMKILAGEKDSLVYDFVVGCHIRKIQFYSFLHKGEDFGWRTVSIHDIPESDGCERGSK